MDYGKQDGYVGVWEKVLELLQVDHYLKEGEGVPGLFECVFAQ